LAEAMNRKGCGFLSTRGVGGWGWGWDLLTSWATTSFLTILLHAVRWTKNYFDGSK
jgi:hypothetical protein